MKRIKIFKKEFTILDERDIKFRKNDMILVEQSINAMTVYLKKMKNLVGKDPSPILKKLDEGLFGIEIHLKEAGGRMLMLDPNYKSSYEKVFKSL